MDENLNACAKRQATAAVQDPRFLKGKGYHIIIDIYIQNNPMIYLLQINIVVFRTQTFNEALMINIPGIRSGDLRG